MPQLLLIIEPTGQRAERGRPAGEAVYQRMLDFAAELQAEGLLLGVNSLGTAARRLAKRDGSAQVWDGPFAEAKELIAGFWMMSLWELGMAAEAVSFFERGATTATPAPRATTRVAAAAPARARPARSESAEDAGRCPAAEWATVEIRGVGPCYM